MFGKNKKPTASDILKMITELPEDELASVKAMLNGDAEETEETEEETVTEETTETEEEFVEQEEDSAEDSVEETADPQEDPPSDDPAGDPASDAEEVEEAAEEVANEEETTENARDIYAEFDELKAAFGALVQRIDSLTAKQTGDSDYDIGMPFGPDITAANKAEDDELERARRAAFGF
jgi:hypothetical protein